jgi:hypothetical protein
MELSQEHKDDFLEFVRDGFNRSKAATKVAEKYEDDRITGTKFKFLCARDPAFNRAYSEALIEGRGAKVERLEECAESLAHGGHWPALKFLLTTYGEQFSWARSSKVEVSGQVEIQAIAGILSRYLPEEEFNKVIEAVESRMIEEGAPGLPLAVDEAA